MDTEVQRTHTCSTIQSKGSAIPLDVTLSANSKYFTSPFDVPSIALFLPSLLLPVKQD